MLCNSECNEPALYVGECCFRTLWPYKTLTSGVATDARVACHRMPPPLPRWLPWPTACAGRCATWWRASAPQTTRRTWARPCSHRRSSLPRSPLGWSHRCARPRRQATRSSLPNIPILSARSPPRPIPATVNVIPLPRSLRWDRRKTARASPGRAPVRARRPPSWTLLTAAGTSEGRPRAWHWRIRQSDCRRRQCPLINISCRTETAPPIIKS